MLRSLAQPVPDILNHRLHDSSTAHVVATILNHRYVAEPAQRRLPRRGCLDAVPPVLVDPHLSGELQLLADLVHRDVAPEERADSRNSNTDGRHWNASR